MTIRCIEKYFKSKNNYLLHYAQTFSHKYLFCCAKYRQNC